MPSSVHWWPSRCLPHDVFPAWALALLCPGDAGAGFGCIGVSVAPLYLPSRYPGRV